jgi:hypothetical protein
MVAFFNSTRVDDFVEKVLVPFSEAVGRGVEDIDCSFPGDVEIGDGVEPFDGVSFSFHENEVILRYEEFLERLVMVCQKYLEERPEDREIVDRLLEEIKDNAIPKAHEDYLKYHEEFINVD